MKKLNSLLTIQDNSRNISILSAGLLSLLNCSILCIWFNHFFIAWFKIENRLIKTKVIFIKDFSMKRIRNVNINSKTFYFKIRVYKICSGNLFLGDYLDLPKIDTNPQNTLLLHQTSSFSCGHISFSRVWRLHKWDHQTLNEVWRQSKATQGIFQCEQETSSGELCPIWWFINSKQSHLSILQKHLN